MTRPLLLDLFCGAGGAATGYHRAGFDVVGVDVEYQAHYPFDFVQADAIAVLSRLADGDGAWSGAPDFDAFHASPPCQDHMETPHKPHGTGWMLPASRFYLERQPRPWVIENVKSAPLRPDFKLCGCQFGLMQLRRERWFETSWRHFEMSPAHNHGEDAISVVGHGTPSWVRAKLGRNPTIAEYRACMGGIDWMNRDELSQAIPPQYTEHIGAQLLAHLAAEATS